jgi:alginate O-acetyltransferase complex protein AlgJ
MATLGTLEQRLQVGLFALFLALPAVDMAFHVDPTPPPSSQERVEPPPLPTELAGLEPWRDGFETYIDDAFGWRSWAVRSFNRLNYRLFRVSQQPAVIVGKNGWLFYGPVLPYQRAIEPMSGTERRRWGNSIQRRHDWLAAQGIEYLFFIAPNKHSIYPEFLPASARRTGPYTRYEQLLDYFRKNRSTVDVVDLHAPLLAAKQSELVYQRTGTHWNTRGAYVAYRAIFDHLHTRFPQLEPVAWEGLRLRGEGPGELPRMLGVEGLVDEDVQKLLSGVRYVRPHLAPYNRLVTEQDDATLPRALIFHDSFTVSLIPFLAEHFSYAVFQWGTVFDGPLVLEVHPDVVIDERVERELLLPPWRNDLPALAETPPATAPASEGTS